MILLRAGLLALLMAAPVLAADPETTVWSGLPASVFQEAFPLGNGRIGAMVFGGFPEERVVLNENSLWSGSKQDADREGAAQFLPEIRKLLLVGKNTEAEKIVNEHFTCQGGGSSRGAKAPYGSYQTLGNLRVRFDEGGGAPAEYRRELDLATALARVGYTKDGIRFSRENFVSAPDEVFVGRYTADRPRGLSFTVSLDRPERFEVRATAPGELLMTGTLDDGRGGKGVSYAARLRAIVRGGDVRSSGNVLRVTKADEVILLLAASTDYRGFAGRNTDDPVAATTQDLDRAATKDYARLRGEQVADHAKFFRRVELRLPETPASSLPTEERLKAFSACGEDPALAALYFNFGRYLLISSSRLGGLPANLQGLWAEEIQAPWNADWHLNINVQMNYWPAEVCGLPELHEPLFRLIRSLIEPGRRTAHSYYDARGWMVHVITNPWGFTSPGEQASWGSSIIGSAWLCHHLWEHYAFTGDLEFLRQAYPIMKEACLFYTDYLMEEPDHHWLVTGPSNSPENRFFLPDGKKSHLCLGPTIDMQLLRGLFLETAWAARILNVDPERSRELETFAGRLAPNQIASDGRLQEWLQPYREVDPTHRHISHLWGLYPGHQISRSVTPELAEACRKSLEARGDQGTGWALAWRLNCWARLGDGDRCESLLRRLFTPARVEEGKGPDGKMYYDGRGAGTFSNLFDSCPPFQIDGNFGGTAGIAEMLLQSSFRLADDGRWDCVIELLPALPKSWFSGQVSGLRARGGFLVDIEWKHGNVTKYHVSSTKSLPVTVRLNGRAEKILSEALVATIPHHPSP